MNIATGISKTNTRTAGFRAMPVAILAVNPIALVIAVVISVVSVLITSFRPNEIPICLSLGLALTDLF